MASLSTFRNPEWLGENNRFVELPRPATTQAGPEVTAGAAGWACFGHSTERLGERAAWSRAGGCDHVPSRCEGRQLGDRARKEVTALPQAGARPHSASEPGPGGRSRDGVLRSSRDRRVTANGRRATRSPSPRGREARQLPEPRDVAAGPGKARPPREE